MDFYQMVCMVSFTSMAFHWLNVTNILITIKQKHICIDFGVRFKKTCQLFNNWSSITILLQSSEWNVDRIFSVSLSFTIIIDVGFTHNYFHVPYFMHTDSSTLNQIRVKESKESHSIYISIMYASAHPFHFGGTEERKRQQQQFVN